MLDEGHVYRVSTSSRRCQICIVLFVARCVKTESNQKLPKIASSAYTYRSKRLSPTSRSTRLLSNYKGIIRQTGRAMMKKNEDVWSHLLKPLVVMSQASQRASWSLTQAVVAKKSVERSMEPDLYVHSGSATLFPNYQRNVRRLLCCR